MEKLLGHRIEAHWRAPCPTEAFILFYAPTRIITYLLRLLRMKSKADNNEEEEEDNPKLCSERVRQL